VTLTSSTPDALWASRSVSLLGPAAVVCEGITRTVRGRPLLADLGLIVDVGRHELERLARASLVVTSPGVPPSARPLAFARENGIRIASEVEVALHFLEGPRVIAVTGTNGKTTTTALISHLLRGLDLEAVEAGNIGTPLSEVAIREQQPKWISLEMSSFQLHDTPSLKPDVGVLTNLSPDHLDRYSTVAEYYADKARLFVNANGDSVWVVNEDDEAVKRMVRAISSSCWERPCCSARIFRSWGRTTSPTPSPHRSR